MAPIGLNHIFNTAFGAGTALERDNHRLEDYLPHLRCFLK
jgi:hypothetical protein